MGHPQLEDDTAFEQAFADELEPGHQLMHGQYTIEAFLNAGGFGITYTARDSLDRKVVIKECFPGSFCRRTAVSVQARSRAHQRELASVVRLFVQEARSLAKLDHPNIVGVHQVFEENNTAYMALDFVEGRDLLDMIEAPTEVLEPDEVEAILRKLLDAVKFIHSMGLLHRDIAPDNILIEADRTPILIDFGAAREQASKQSRVLTAMRVVKDGYSPQEFYIQGSAQGPYSDLYALGATFYHLITGDLPANAQARLAAVAAGDPDPYEPLADRLTLYRPEFLAAIDQALAILPKDRLASADAWLELLDNNRKVVALYPDAAEAKRTQVDGASDGSKKAGGKGKVALLAGVAVIAIVAAGVATQTNLFGGGDPAPAQLATPGTAADASPEEGASAAPVLQDAPPTGGDQPGTAAVAFDLPMNPRLDRALPAHVLPRAPAKILVPLDPRADLAMPSELFPKAPAKVLVPFDPRAELPLPEQVLPSAPNPWATSPELFTHVGQSRPARLFVNQPALRFASTPGPFVISAFEAGPSLLSPSLGTVTSGVVPPDAVSAVPNVAAIDGVATSAVDGPPTPVLTSTAQPVVGADVTQSAPEAGTGETLAALTVPAGTDAGREAALAPARPEAASTGVPMAALPNPSAAPSPAPMPRLALPADGAARVAVALPGTHEGRGFGALAQAPGMPTWLATKEAPFAYTKLTPAPLVTTAPFLSFVAPQTETVLAELPSDWAGAPAVVAAAVPSPDVQEQAFAQADPAPKPAPASAPEVTRLAQGPLQSDALVPFWGEAGGVVGVPVLLSLAAPLDQSFTTAGPADRPDGPETPILAALGPVAAGVDTVLPAQPGWDSLQIAQPSMPDWVPTSEAAFAYSALGAKPALAGAPNLRFAAAELGASELSVGALPGALAAPTVPGAQSVLAVLTGADMLMSLPTADLRAPTPLDVQPERYDLPGVLTGWVAELPYDGFFSRRTGETQIFAVNGVEVASATDFEAALRATSQPPNGREVAMQLTAGLSREGARLVDWALPVVHRTAFVNGLSFETRWERDAWVTRVVNVSSAQDMDLRPGDVVAGDLSNSQPFDTRTSLPDRLKRAHRDGERVLTLAVRREGTLTIVTLPVPI